MVPCCETGSPFGGGGIWPVPPPLIAFRSSWFDVKSFCIVIFLNFPTL